MGIYANQLAALNAAGAEWKIDYFSRLKTELKELESKMEEIAATPGWTGESALAAQQEFLTLRARFAALQEKLAAAQQVITNANNLRIATAAKHSSLPSGSIPWEWQIAIGALAVGTTITLPGIGVLAAEVAYVKATEYFGAEREAAAEAELKQFEQNLKQPVADLNSARLSNAVWTDAPPPADYPGPPVTWHGDSFGNNGWTTGPTGGGSGGGGGYTAWTPKWNGSTYIVDEPGVLHTETGHHTGGPTVSVDGDSGGGTSAGGFGLGGGGLGAGLGAGAGAAGALGASKLAGKGLFGSGLAGAGSGAGAGAGPGAGLGGGAGRGGNSSMMGGGGGGAGGGDKEKRSSLGLVAPKLEDDEDAGPRSAAAGAGGRD